VHVDNSSLLSEVSWTKPGLHIHANEEFARAVIEYFPGMQSLQVCSLAAAVVFEYLPVSQGLHTGPETFSYENVPASHAVHTCVVFAIFENTPANPG